jgi:hypothetical protein
MLAVWAHPNAHAVIVIGVAIGQFDADDSAELVGRRITLLDIRPQFVVRLVLAPVLGSQDVEDVAGVPANAAFGAVAVVVQTGCGGVK